jgi:quinol monooxygenase YgiN
MLRLAVECSTHRGNYSPLPNHDSMKQPPSNYLAFFLLTATIIMINATNLSAQSETTYMRIAKITVDSTKLDAYLTALKQQMQSALQQEKGVLAYAAVQDKKSPYHITILETYASTDAYQLHTQTEHFKKYKAAVAGMVLQLELTDVIPIGIQSKLK